MSVLRVRVRFFYYENPSRDRCYYFLSPIQHTYNCCLALILLFFLLSMMESAVFKLYFCVLITWVLQTIFIQRLFTSFCIFARLLDHSCWPAFRIQKSKNPTAQYVNNSKTDTCEYFILYYLSERHTYTNAIITVLSLVFIIIYYYLIDLIYFYQ